MKMNAIRAACKARGIAYLFTDHQAGRQWLSDGAGTWPVYGLRLDEEALRVIWDFTPRDWTEKILFREVARTPENESAFALMGDTYESEEPLELNEVRFLYGGYAVAQLTAPGGGVAYVDTSELKPVRAKDESGDRYFLRTDGARGVRTVAYYHDLLCAATVELFAPEFVREMREALGKAGRGSL